MTAGRPAEPARNHPTALIGSALLIDSSTPRKALPPTTVTQWHSEAWDMFDRVSEFQSGVTWKASAMARINLTVARVPENPGDAPAPADPDDADAKPWFDLISAFGGGASGHGQIMAGCSTQLEVAGMGYIHGEIGPDDEFTRWNVLSTEEVTYGAAGWEVADQDTGEKRPLGEDLLIRFHRSHPRRSWEPQAPAKALLPALRVLDTLTSRANVEAISRLLGNGILFMPEGAEFFSQHEDGTVDPLLNDLMKVASLAIQQPDTAAAGTPIVIRMKADLIEKVKHMSFWSELDSMLSDMQDAQIRRLALGLDIPPEILLGVGDMNHWSAWLVDETAVKIHVQPPVELICDAITRYYLRPAAEEAGLPDPDKWMVWYDATELKARPDLTPAASEAHTRGVITDEAYLKTIGLAVEDMPKKKDMNAAKIASMVVSAPSLAPILLPLTGLVPEDWTPPAGGVVETIDVINEESAEDTVEPSNQPPTQDPDDPSVSASAIVEAADAMMCRALEVAGKRLVSAASKGKRGGAASIDTSDPTSMHTRLNATELASTDHLLSGAWDRVDEVAPRLGVDPDAMRERLHVYATSLIATGAAHDFETLRAALGV